MGAPVAGSMSAQAALAGPRAWRSAGQGRAQAGRMLSLSPLAHEAHATGEPDSGRHGLRERGCLPPESRSRLCTSSSSSSPSSISSSSSYSYAPSFLLSQPSPLANARPRLAHASAALADASAAGAHDEQQPSGREGQESRSGLLGAFLGAVQERYLGRNPTSKRALDLVHHWHTQGSLEHQQQQHQGDAGAAAPLPRSSSPVVFDHLAFRTFGADSCGISAVSPFLQAFGFSPQDPPLLFPSKKLRAIWFSPPPASPPLPRIFVSELAVEDLSVQAQGIIRGYTQAAQPLALHAFALSPLLPRPWPHPTAQHFLALARESEYAAWTLVNGYSLNHTTISVHNLCLTHPPTPRAALSQGALGPAAAPLLELNRRLQSEGMRLNQQGGEVKVSPDGLLLQSSTLADAAPFAFSDGETLEVPLSYMEFALRLVLPQYAHLPLAEVQEHHRRDGFEVGNADKIFESTSSTQRT